ncbi:MAG: hypothetical protein P8N97_00625 [Alphaproteobacteria bacterium]|nr:hypothetical protein [Alphaproteobacteria bacterium]
MLIDNTIHDTMFTPAGFTPAGFAPAGFAPAGFAPAGYSPRHNPESSHNDGTPRYNKRNRLFISSKHDKLSYSNLTYYAAIRKCQIMNDPSDILSSWAEFRLNPPSSYLLNCLRHIHDATDIRGDAVFSPRVATLITTMIASRSYGQELYRLCGFMSAAAVSGIDAGALLLGGRATAARVNRLFDDASIPDTVHIVDRYIMLTAHTPAYQIDMARCPVILGLANFICEALGFDIFINIYDQLGQDTKPTAIKTISNDLSKQLYRFLGDHLPRSSERKITMLLQDYLASQISNDHHLSAVDVDDALIFDFWCAKSLDPEYSLKLYDTCLRAWISFRQGLELASHSSAHPDSLDDAAFRLDHLALRCFHNADYDQSIRDTGSAPALMQSSDTWMHDEKQTMRSAFHELTAPPIDTIKMLNNGEKDKLSLMIHADTHATALYRSLLRGVVFSPVQNRLTQALRDHPDNQPDMASMMPPENQSAYSAWLAEWRDIVNVARGCVQTACQRLIEARDIQGLQILMRQLSEQARGELAMLMQGKGLSETSADITAETMFAALDQGKTAPALKAECADIKKAARAYRRAGLKQPPAGINDPDVWYDRLYAAAELTEVIIEAMDQFLMHLAEVKNLDDQFKQDHAVFAEQFSRIYKSEEYND